MINKVLNSQAQSTMNQQKQIKAVWLKLFCVFTRLQTDQLLLEATANSRGPKRECSGHAESCTGIFNERANTTVTIGHMSRGSAGVYQATTRLFSGALVLLGPEQSRAWGFSTPFIIARG